MLFFSYSQYGQDLYLINSIFPDNTRGYFVDVGAYNGILLSNTFILEKHLGWNGICVEANPNVFKFLRENRNCICSSAALHKEPGLELKFLIDQQNAGVLSGFTTHLDHHSPKGVEIFLTTSTLTDLLNEWKAPSYIEYISIDTEGSELEILKGIDFNKYQFGYMTIEHNGVEPKRSQIRDFLKLKGYYYHRANEGDDDFVSICYDETRKNFHLQSEFEKAIKLHKSRNFTAAAKIYWQILRYFPEYHQAFHNLGIIMLQVGSNDLALDLIRRAQRLAPEDENISSNLEKILSRFST